MFSIRFADNNQMHYSF